MDTSTVHIEADGVDFELVLPSESDDPVVQSYLRGEPLNNPLVELLRLLVPQRGTVLDLGCHVGTFSIAAAALGHRVVAIDASATHVELVRASARANGLSDVDVVQSAVSDHRGKVRFIEQGLFGRVDSDGKFGSEIEADTTANLLSTVDCPVTDVGFIKMDIEGSELRALRGSVEWLQSPGAPPILYESNPRTAEFFGYSIEELRLELNLLGYETYRPEPDGLFLSKPREPQPESWVDLIALKPGHLEVCGLRVKGQLPRKRLIAKFDEWTRPSVEDNVRAYAALQLAERWADLGGNRAANKLFKKLSRDDSPDVRAALERAGAERA